MNSITHIRDMLAEKLKQEDFVIDKTGVKTIELIGESFKIDEESIFGKLSVDYAEKELDWYKSESLNVYDMPNPPQIWKDVADKDGNVNSNYGWCIYSKENGRQYKNALRELRKNKDTRRASMIYTRPNMHTDYNHLGKSDFICTTGVTYEIRDDKLHAVVQLRSNDSVFGFLNDSYWQRYVQAELFRDLIKDYPKLEIGDIIWNSASLHIYERHFYYLYHYIKTGEITLPKSKFREMYSKYLVPDKNVIIFYDGDHTFKL